jgi:deoxyribodipyrimidine photo-lyase
MTLSNFNGEHGALLRAFLPHRTVWFRRDLRATDHAALYHALTQCQQVHCAFVFDPTSLTRCRGADRRVEFIRESLARAGPSAANAVCPPTRRPDRAARGGHEAVPAAGPAWGCRRFCQPRRRAPGLARDSLVRTRLATAGSWLAHLQGPHHSGAQRGADADGHALQRVHALQERLAAQEGGCLSTSKATRWSATRTAWRPARLDHCPRAHAGVAMGFEPTTLSQLKAAHGAGVRSSWTTFWAASNYDDTRDFPAVKGPSYLSVHLRFGTVSIRLLARRRTAAHAGGQPGRRHLAQRADLARLLLPDPAPPSPCGGAQLQARVRRHRGSRGAADALLQGLVRGPHRLPAGGCRHGAAQPDGLHAQPPAHGGGQLSCEGPGHRLAPGRAPILPQHLNDFDLAANNGGWQWASSSGCDAQPYFRIFNPVSQSEKFDPRASSSAATCRNWPGCFDQPLGHHGLQIQ